MKVKKIDESVFVFSFPLMMPDYEGEVNVGAILGKEDIYIFDTSWRKEHMEEVKLFLASVSSRKNFIIINSHADFDHFIGNSTFPDAEIISTSLCFQTMKSQSCRQIQKKYKIQLSTEDKIYLPNATYDSDYRFLSDKLTFLPSPIHTVDSACLYLTEKQILFAGDNIEAPIPYLNHDNLDLIKLHYRKLKNLQPLTIVPGHGHICDVMLLDENLAYIDALMNDNTAKYEKSPYAEIHQTNLETLQWK